MNPESRDSGFALRAPRNDEKLLPVAGQHLLARLAEPGAVLLQARQHDLVAVIEMGAAKARGVARAGVLALLLLRRSR